MTQVTYQIELDREELDTILKALEIYHFASSWAKPPGLPDPLQVHDKLLERLA